MFNLDFSAKIKELQKAVGAEGEVRERSFEPQTIKKFPMKFDLRSFEIPGVGYYSAIEMTALFGLMKMVTVVLTPMEVDMPLLSYDYINAAGKDTLLLEMYDTLISERGFEKIERVGESYKVFVDREKKPDWSDEFYMKGSLGKVGKNLSGEFSKMASDWIDAYIEEAKSAPKCAKEAKRTASKKYVDRLFKDGGVAVNQFKKMLGDEAAVELLGKYIFSTEA
ncbi:MAG: hypothetical protein IJP43_10130 [Oscillospiraceae bacterium]|nr:hypothetical protein [Oscillospiraceae bacterium]